MRTIRNAKDTDLDRIREIVSSALRESVVDSDEQHAFLYRDICKSLDWWADNRDCSVLLVCESGDTVLGYVLVKEYWNLSALFVDPEQQGLGVGRDLATSVIKLCEKRSPKACLMLNSSNNAAPFYEAMGFTQTGSGLDKPGGCVPFQYKF